MLCVQYSMRANSILPLAKLVDLCNNLYEFDESLYWLITGTYSLFVRDMVREAGLSRSAKWDTTDDYKIVGDSIMFAVNTYEEIEKNERLLNEKHIIALLFVRPSLSGAKDIINEFNYIHYNSGKYCSIYAIGYTNDEAFFEHYTTVAGIDGVPWYYNDSAFIVFKNQLEQRLKWKYSGEIELIILQSNPEGKEILNFRNYLAIDVNYGIRNNYIDSFNRFMESLIRNARSEVETKDWTRKMNRSQYGLKDILVRSIGECKKIPAPIQDIIKDNLFYRTSKSY